MPYEKHTWVDGEEITASKLNNIENGIAQGGGGSKRYAHNITLSREGDGLSYAQFVCFTIVNNNPNPYDTDADVLDALADYQFSDDPEIGFVSAYLSGETKEYLLTSVPATGMLATTDHKRQLDGYDVVHEFSHSVYFPTVVGVTSGYHLNDPNWQGCIAVLIYLTNWDSAGSYSENSYNTHVYFWGTGNEDNRISDIVIAY